jgi:hypothetical protein
MTFVTIRDAGPGGAIWLASRMADGRAREVAGSSPIRKNDGPCLIEIRQSDYAGAIKTAQQAHAQFVWHTVQLFALACLLGCTGILVHSFVDFNLQIPANSAWFYVLAVLAASPYAVETRQRVRRMRSRNETDSPVSQTAPEGTL